MSFLNDLSTGKRAEELVAEELRTKGFKVGFNTAKDRKTLKEFDLILNDKIKVEVKTDLQTNKTGNTVVEFECNNKPSGITSSKSPLWVYVIDDILYFFKLKTLKQLAKDKQYKRIVKGGDGWRSKMYLFDFEELKKHTIQI